MVLWMITLKKSFSPNIKRVNPFQADLEMNLLSNSRSNLLSQIDDAVARGDIDETEIDDIF